MGSRKVGIPFACCSRQWAFANQLMRPQPLLATDITDWIGSNLGVAAGGLPDLRGLVLTPSPGRGTDTHSRRVGGELFGGGFGRRAFGRLALQNCGHERGDVAAANRMSRQGWARLGRSSHRSVRHRRRRWPAPACLAIEGEVNVLRAVVKLREPVDASRPPPSHPRRREIPPPPNGVGGGPDEHDREAD